MSIIKGTLNDDHNLHGTTGNDYIYGYKGNDDLYGHAGNDFLYGGDGNDILWGDATFNNGVAGNDVLDGGNGDDGLNGGLGDDIYIVGSGHDYINDWGGNDLLQFQNVSIDNIKFTEDSGQSLLTISFGAGAPAADILSTTTIEYMETDDGFRAYLPDWQSWKLGTAGADDLNGSYRNDTMIGRAGDDTLTGFGGNDNMHGGAGNDTLYGGLGQDILHGGTGKDVLFGDNAADQLYGGAGADTLYGGIGADLFGFLKSDAVVVNGVKTFQADSIKDFNAFEHDVIDLHGMLESYNSLTDAITDFVKITTSGGNSIISVDMDGAGSAYAMTKIAVVEGVTGMTDVEAQVAKGTLIV